MEKSRKNKGITLVALIITIIILLILAGVTIIVVTQTGLLKSAKRTKKATENAQIEENTILESYENKINKVVGGVSGSRDDISESDGLKKQKTMSEAEHFIGEYYLDGKPIYSKTINCGNYPNKNQIRVSHNVTNYDKMWIDVSNSYVINQKADYTIPCVYLNNVSSGIGTFVSGNDIVLSASDDRSGCVGIITIKYTKTTD